MITKETIMEAYLFMRKENQSVPSETLEFMKDTALAELQKCKVENLHTQRVSNSVYCDCAEKEVLILPHSNTPYCAECGKNIKQ